MDYNESTVKATIIVTSVNKEEMEKLILQMLKFGGIDELEAKLALNSAALL